MNREHGKRKPLFRRAPCGVVALEFAMVLLPCVLTVLGMVDLLLLVQRSADLSASAAAASAVLARGGSVAEAESAAADRWNSHADRPSLNVEFTTASRPLVGEFTLIKVSSEKNSLLFRGSMSAIGASIPLLP